MTIAEQEYHRVRRLAAFSITLAPWRKVNQHLREYTFADGSVLRLYSRGYATAATGPQGPVMVIGNIRTNGFGD